MKVCLVGRGKVGRSLAHALSRAGLETQLVRGNPLARAVPAADVYILSVPDTHLRETAAHLAPQLTARAVVLHCAGARGPQELAAAKAAGASVAGFHPLVSFAQGAGPVQLANATFVVQGDPRAVRMARRLARALAARCVVRPVLGPSYHAAAALVANGSAALGGVGVEILLELGFSRREAERALAALLHSVAENIARVGLPAALTGPVVRGDATTVEAHLLALGALDGSLQDAYASVQPVVLACARSAGLKPTSARRIEALLEASPRPTRRGRRKPAQPKR